MLTVYTGCMFASKTTSLIAEAQIALEENKSVLLLKPSIDSRYGESDIKTHDGLSATELGLTPFLIPTDWEIDKKIFLHNSETSKIDLVCIDEVQFLKNADLIVKEFLSKGIDVVCAGLDLDSFGNSFGKMGELLCLADIIQKCVASCAVCGETATRTFRKLSADQSQVVVVGGSNMFEPRCYKHWEEGRIESAKWLVSY